MGYVEQHSGSKGNNTLWESTSTLDLGCLQFDTQHPQISLSVGCVSEKDIWWWSTSFWHIFWHFFDLARHQLQTSIYLSLFTWIAWDAPFSMIRCFTQFSSQHSQNHDKPRLANLCHLLHPAVAKGKHDRFDLSESTLRHLAFPKTFSCRIRCAWLNSSKK